MSKNRRSKITDAAAEQLLSGQGEIGPAALRQVFAAAAGSATPDELAGEQAALAHFRAAHLSPVGTARRRSLLKTAAAKLLAAKVVIGAGFAAAATGGVAVAAATHHLPGPLQHEAHAAPSGNASKSDHPSGSASTHSSNKPTTSPGAPGQGGEHSSGPATHTPHATPSPSLRGLCTAYNAGVATNPGKALNNPAFTALITAAGGKDNVAAYCVTVLASAHPSGKPSASDHPSDSDHPTAPNHPTEAPSTHPSGPPSTHPSAPATHPSGPPSTSPTRH